MVRLPFFLHRIEVNIMAATRLIALHINKGKSVAQCLRDRTNYAQNPEKTEKGELVTAYECDPMTADQEFLLSKRQYEYITGRRHKRDVIAYQIRQSFKPGEITPEDRAKLIVSRQALHSALLEVRHPTTNELIRVESPLPEELAACIPEKIGLY